MSLPGAFNRYRTEIDAGLRMALAERQSPLYDMLRYHLGWLDEKGNPLRTTGGKALRPTLCLLACEAVGGNYRQALPAATAVELVHNYSLIHDDIQDEDRERRHRPTVWSIWGKAQAINAGTAMRILANLALSRLPSPKQLRAQYLIDESCLSLIEGQYLDISYETRLDITVDDYLQMVLKKTAMLIACSLELGAWLGTDDEVAIEGFRSIGKKIGLAFQIRDDILGIWGDEQKTGKPSGSDIKRKKKSFPVIYALAKAERELRAELAEFYRNGIPGADGAAAVLRILETVQSQLQAQRLAERYRNEAVSGLEALPVSVAAKHDLREVFNFLVERSF